jgi:hypothetical protein
MCLEEAAKLIKCLTDSFEQIGLFVDERLIRDVLPKSMGQCRLAYFDHAATWGFARLTSVMVGGAWWRVPWSPGLLTR